MKKKVRILLLALLALGLIQANLLATERNGLIIYVGGVKFGCGLSGQECYWQPPPKY